LGSEFPGFPKERKEKDCCKSINWINRNNNFQEHIESMFVNACLRMFDILVKCSINGMECMLIFLEGWMNECQA
jgi:hypothetical protein